MTGKESTRSEGVKETELGGDHRDGTPSPWVNQSVMVVGQVEC